MKLIDCRLMQTAAFGIEHGFQPTSAIFFVVSGRFSLRVQGGGEAHVVGPNMLAFFPQDMEFERRVIEPISFYHVKVEEQGELPRGIAVPKNSIRMLGTLSYMSELELQTPRGVAQGAHCLADLFMQLEIEQSIRKTQNGAVLRAAMAYFEAHLSQKISLAEVARHVGISPNGLIRHFRLYADTTPIRALNALRIRRAETLLCTTDQPLHTIARACGFDNAFYFSNTFKKEKGISPSAYRATFAI